MAKQQFDDQLRKLTYSYCLLVPEVVAGANKVHLDIFNGSDSSIMITDYYISTKTDVAVTGAVSARFDIHRTATIGTGGTVATYNGTSPSSPTIYPLSSSNPDLPVNYPLITARSAPTGGAASTGWIYPVYQFSEETNAGTILQQYYNILATADETQPLVITASQGLTVIQGSVASLNNYTHIIYFTVI